MQDRHSSSQMIVLKKLVCEILWLVCLCAASRGSRNGQIEAIASALRASEFDRAFELTRALP